MKFNLKLKRMGWLILGSVVLAAVAALLLVNYLGQLSQRNTLLADVDKASMALSKATADMRTMEPQLTQTEEKLNQANISLNRLKTSLGNLDSLSSAEQLLRLAENNSLQIINMRSSDPIDEKRDSVTLATVRFDVELKGKPADVQAFVRSLLNSQTFISYSIVNLSTAEMQKDTAALHINLIIYSYKSG